MIPKIIHYCWFGGNPLPQLALDCIASWKKFFPEYEIIQWDESNFDVNMIPYTAEAYRQKKYAFVSDYARFWIIYNYGGLYFDTDVEVIRPMNEIITDSNYMGFEQDPDGKNTPGKYAPRYCFGVNPGLGFGMEKGHPFAKRMLELYKSLSFKPIPTDISWYKTIVAYTTEELCKCGLKNIKGVQNIDCSLGNDCSSVTIYPSEYFAPINVISGRLHITERTYTVHHYTATWSEKRNKSFKSYLWHYMPECFFLLYNIIKRERYRIKI